jgi:hypothetical protein
MAIQGYQRMKLSNLLLSFFESEEVIDGYIKRYAPDVIYHFEIYKNISKFDFEKIVKDGGEVYRGILDVKNNDIYLTVPYAVDSDNNEKDIYHRELFKALNDNGIKLQDELNSGFCFEILNKVSITKSEAYPNKNFDVYLEDIHKKLPWCKINTFQDN